MSNRAGGALPKPFDISELAVIGVDETMHGLIECEHPETNVPEFPNPVTVQCEDDLIGKKACIAYEDSLQQLGTFLQLPIKKCTYTDPVTGAECGCCPPFLAKQTSRGSAIIMEWVSSILRHNGTHLRDNRTHLDNLTVLFHLIALFTCCAMHN